MTLATRLRGGWLPGWTVVAALTLLGLVHAALIWPHYHVGSFDDDASYIETARALLSGAGLTTPLPQGTALAATYPPGYPALLVPIVALAGHSLWPLRLLSTLCYALVFPLTWIYLRERALGEPVRVVVLALLALGPVPATYAVMVMAEMPFLVAFLVFLLLVARWDRDERRLSPAGVGAVIAVAGLVWLKEAALGLAVGLVAWQLLRRRPGRALATAAGVALLLAPVVVARLVTGTALLGARYSTEISGYLAGGLVGRVIHVAPQGLATLLGTALPQSVVPTMVSPLPATGVTVGLFFLLRLTAAPFTLLGFADFVRHHRDVTAVAIPAYVGEVLLFPYINERRVILVLPVVLAWYVLGVALTGRSLARAARRLHRRAELPVTALAATLAAGLALGALLPQLPRDYLYSLRQSSSRPRGSPYMRLLAAVGTPREVVETDYLWTTSWLTGHRTARGAYLQAIHGSCTPAAVHAALQADNAAYVLTAALNSLGLSSTCLLGILDSEPWSVPLLGTRWDSAAVFALVGPGSPHPRRVDLAANPPQLRAAVVCPPPLDGCSAAARVRSWRTEDQLTTRGTPAPAAGSGAGAGAGAGGGQVILSWSWPGVRWVHLFTSQLVVVAAGAAGAAGTPPPGAVRSVTLQLLDPAGRWVTVATTAGAVDAPAGGPALVAGLPGGEPARGARLVATTTAGDPGLTIAGVHLLASGS